MYYEKIIVHEYSMEKDSNDSKKKSLQNLTYAAVLTPQSCKLGLALTRGYFLMTNNLFLKNKNVDKNLSMSEKKTNHKLFSVLKAV